MKVRFVIAAAAVAAIAAATAGAASTPLSPAAGTVVSTTHPKFKWAIAPGEVAELIAIASSPATTSTGDFASGTLVDSSPLAPDATSWSPTKPLPAGKYWWHVVSHSTTAGAGWAHLFTPTLRFTVGAVVSVQSIALKFAGSQFLATVSLLGNIRNVNVVAKLYDGKKQIGVQKTTTDNFLIDQPAQAQSLWTIPGTIKHRAKLRLVVTLTVSGQTAKATATKNFRAP